MIRTNYCDVVWCTIPFGHRFYHLSDKIREFLLDISASFTEPIHCKFFQLDTTKYGQKQVFFLQFRRLFLFLFQWFLFLNRNFIILKGEIMSVYLRFIYILIVFSFAFLGNFYVWSKSFVFLENLLTTKHICCKRNILFKFIFMVMNSILYWLLHLIEYSFFFVEILHLNDRSMCSKFVLWIFKNLRILLESCHWDPIKQAE